MPNWDNSSCFKLEIEGGETLFLAPGETVLTALQKAGILLENLCGGQGTCGKCRFKLLEGRLETGESPLRLEEGWYLACRAAALSDLKIALPRRQTAQIYTPQPEEPDLSRIDRPFTPLGRKRLAAGPGKHYGIAFDLGTTTLICALLDSDSGAVLSLKGCLNPQVSYGEDVISRIIFTASSAKRRIMQDAAKEGINRLLDAACRASGISPQAVGALCLSGNTTMLHLLYGVDPAPLRREGYVPAPGAFPEVRAEELGINIHPRGTVFSLPPVAAYLGGDVSSGVLSCRMGESDSLSLLMDLGTNGEVALGNREWLLGASCSAGPAFEGGGIKFGMRFSPGAIHKVHLTPSGAAWEVIGGEPPLGICGTGLIDLLAELLNNRLIDRSGRFLPSAAPDLFLNTEEGVAFRLVEALRSGLGEDILIYQNDVDNLIRAKAAMFTGCEFLLRQMGLDFNSLGAVYLAGGFGNCLDLENAVAVGLLPDIPREKFIYAGNTSLKGAMLALLSGSERSKVRQIAGRLTDFDLSREPEFMNRYTAALFLPHTDAKHFPGMVSRPGP